MVKDDLEIPKHIGIICDGNRRFAHTLGEVVWFGHEQGAKKIEEVLGWCKELGINSLTLWLFSTENFSRTKEEIQIKFKFIGDLSLFPENIQNLIKQMEEKTKEHTKFNFNIAAGYGGKQEIIDAAKLIAKKIELGELKSEHITKELFEAHMYSAAVPEVDLVIRTSGELRTSGFLMWKTDYAEYFFSEKYWPEFTKEDFVRAIMSYSARKRRYGK